MKPLKSSITLTINRSQINFAPYNPREDDPKLVKELRSNFQKVGYLGGIVWNSLSGNLVGGHKRVMAHDIHYKYDGTEDYKIKVEAVDLDAINRVKDAKKTQANNSFLKQVEMNNSLIVKFADAESKAYFCEGLGIDFNLTTIDGEQLLSKIDS